MLFQKLNLLQDVDSRWNSALDMFVRLRKLIAAVWVVLMNTEWKHLLPSDSEQALMEALVVSVPQKCTLFRITVIKDLHTKRGNK